MKLIIGLGNPGKQYEKTRHNVGFMVLDALQDEWQREGISAWETSKKFNALVCGITLLGEKIILAKPLTFMNHSGEAVSLLAHYYKIPSRDIIVVHDEKDIPLGTIKVQRNRGDAGHNGIKSIITCIGTKDFNRIRVGVASKDEKKMQDTPTFVLGKFGLLEKKLAQQSIQLAIPEVKKLLIPGAVAQEADSN